MTKKYRMPLIGSGTEEDPYIPKYNPQTLSGIKGVGAFSIASDYSTADVYVDADSSTLETLTTNEDVTEL